MYKNLSLEDIEGEIWKDIKGYEGLYQVSNMGRVKGIERYVKTKNGIVRHKKEKILKQGISSRLQRKSLTVILSREGVQKTFSVHRLIAIAFIPNPENKPQVNHINENPLDNRLTNLEWVTAKENANHGTRNERMGKAHQKPVLQYNLQGELVKRWNSLTECYKNGFWHSSISKCCKGRQKTHKGYVWKYDE